MRRFRLSRKQLAVWITAAIATGCLYLLYLHGRHVTETRPERTPESSQRGGDFMALGHLFARVEQQPSHRHSFPLSRPLTVPPSRPHTSPLSLSFSELRSSKSQWPAVAKALNISSPCKHFTCSEYFSLKDWELYNACYEQSLAKYRRNFHLPNATMLPSGQCRFVNGTGREPVALVSFPGSGNTWVRGLLELATGICTGSKYCDSGLRIGGFTGEGLVSGVVLVVKTHSISPSWTQSEMNTHRSAIYFSSAILVVRSPYDALVSEWNRLKAGTHTGQTGKDVFGNNSEWDSFVCEKIQIWPRYFSWLTKGDQQGHEVFIIQYEDIAADVVREMMKVLYFLNINVSVDALKMKLAHDFVHFKRANHLKDFDPFTQEQRKLVKKVINRTVQFLQSSSHTAAARIVEGYLSDSW